jgi:hypothetical protein
MPAVVRAPIILEVEALPVKCVALQGRLVLFPAGPCTGCSRELEFAKQFLVRLQCM